MTNNESKAELVQNLDVLVRIKTFPMLGYNPKNVCFILDLRTKIENMLSTQKTRQDIAKRYSEELKDSLQYHKIPIEEQEHNFP